MRHEQWELHAHLVHARPGGDQDMENLLNFAMRRVVIDLPTMAPTTFVVSGHAAGAGHFMQHEDWGQPDVGYPIRGAQAELRALLKTREAEVLHGYLLMSACNLSITCLSDKLSAPARNRISEGYGIGFVPIELFRSMAYADQQPGDWDPRVRFTRT